METRGVRWGAWGVLLLATQAHPAPWNFQTRIWTEAPVEKVELVAFPAGRAVAFDPSWPSKPLARVSGKPGSVLSFSLDAPLPLRLEVWASGHVAMGLEVWLPQQLPVPEAWLPRGERKSLLLSGFDRASPVSVFTPLSFTFDLATAALRWRPILPSQQVFSEKKLEVVVPTRSFLPVEALAADGRWARENVSLHSSSHLKTATERIRVRVVNQQGQPVAGVEVATQTTPLGGARYTAADGTAVLWRLPHEPASVVAVHGALGAAAVSREAQVELVLRPLPTLPLVPAKPYGPLLVRNATWPAALSGSFWLFPPEGGTLPALETGGPIWVSAPGYCFGTYWQEEAAGEVVVRLLPAATVRGRTLDPQGRPLAPVPIPVAAPQRAPLSPWERGGAGDQGVLAVSDPQGHWEVQGLPPGDVEVQARWGEWIAPRQKLQLAPGELRAVELVLTPGAHLNATVQDQNGQPLANVRAQVYALNADEVFSSLLTDRESPLAEATSDARGNVVITGLPTGKMGLTLRREGFVPRFVTTVVPAAGLDLGVVTLEPGVEVVGRVVNEQGQGVEAAVELGSSPYGDDLGWAATDPQGFFRFADQPAKGVVYLKASGPNLIPGPPTRLELPPTGPVELRVTTGVSLQGRVVDEASGEPVRRAWVQATLPTTQSGVSWSLQRWGSAFDLTDDEGKFLLRGLPEGTVIVEVQARGYVPLSRTVALETEKPSRPLLLRLNKGLAIAGRVYEASGEPAAGIRVSAWEASPKQARLGGGSTRSASALTDSAGAFEVSGLAPGTYQVEATGFAGEKDRVLVAAGATDVELRLGSLGALEVQVSDQQGAPVAGSRVVLSGGLHDSLEGSVEGPGKWRFANLPSGSYWLEIRAEGFARAVERVEVVGGKTVARTVQLKPGGVVEGLVRGLAPEHLAQTEIRAFHGARTVVEPDGHFRLEGVPLGREPVAARCLLSGATRSAEVEVEPGKPAYVEFDFSKALTLSGRLRRGGAPATGLLVRARVENKASFAEDVTNREGQFQLRELEAGKVRLTVLDPSGQVVMLRKLDVASDDHVELELPAGTLTGRVTSQGEPVSEATVTVSFTPGAYPARVTRTLEDGSFAFKDLPAGRLQVEVTATGYAPLQREVALAENGSQRLEVELQPESGLHVVVRDADGSFPEAVGLMAVQPGNPPTWQWVELDRQGKGLITSLAPGTYLGLWRSGGAVVAPFTVPGALNLQLKPAGKLEITTGEAGGEVLVVTADGTPLPPLAVSLATADGWTRLPPYLNPTLSVPVGSYTVRLRRQGQLREKTVQVQVGTVAFASFKD